MHHLRRGTGKPLLLIHGLGQSARSWDPIMDTLAARREVIAVDLPGFGETPAVPGGESVATLTDTVESFIGEQGLDGVDVAGSSMGARMALELVRRGSSVGSVVALDPGGFWTDRQAKVFHASVAASIRLVRSLMGVMPTLTASAVGRTLLFSQFSAHPWRLDPDLLLTEMRAFASSPSFDAVLADLAEGPRQEGAAPGTAPGALTIAWGRQDKVTLPSQAETALERFPDARMHWFERCGHFPQWDVPQQAARMILDHTG